jgi:tetratricopeptide (TPR) repeat protein
MSKQMEASRFILSPLSSKPRRFYQEILQGLGSYQQLGDRLIQLAEQAHAFRQFDQVKEYGQLLSNIPIKSYQAIGYYYLAIATNSRGNGDQETAKKLFELVANAAPHAYRAKAILSLAALSLHAGDYESQFRFLLEAGRTACDVSTAIRSRLGIAIHKSMEGFHKHSLKDLENLYNVARLSRPIVFFDYLNSYAVELGEAGCTNEARNISQLVIKSPFAFAYPEWQETANEFKAANRSLVALNPSQYISRKVLSMPEREHEGEAKQESQPARVMSLQKWKRKMAKKKKDEPEPEDEREMFFWIMEVYARDETSDDQRRKIYEAVKKVMSEPDKTEPDDDDPQRA